MFRSLPIRGCRILKSVVTVFLSLFILNEAMSQCGNATYPNAYPTLKGQRISNLNIAGGYYNGLIQWLPSDYNSTSQDYPVIIYFHGAGAVGNGSATSLCSILMDQYDPGKSTTLPNRIENGGFGAGVVPAVSGTQFIVLAPQYASYNSPFLYSSQTDDLIDYIVANYRVDESRIYLTGMSTGANQVIDYLSASQANSERIAAAAFGALCFPTNLASTPQGPANIANGDVATWFVHCGTESDQYCGVNTPNGWVNAINSNSPTVAPRLTVFPGPNSGGQPYPQSLNYCQGFAHDAWTALYSPDFAPTGGGPDFYAWALMHQSESALPVTLKSFTARLSNGKVYLRWVTSSEQENAGFTIERAGSTGDFSAIKQIAGGGNSGGDKIYEYVDEQPLVNLSFYRLKQQDLNGRNRLFETRKVMNKSRFKSMVIITPNPFIDEPSAFINVDKKQKVSVWVTDMSGRILSTVNGIYDAGTTELTLPTGKLPRGVYFVKVSGENITETHKIIKQ